MSEFAIIAIMHIITLTGVDPNRVSSQMTTRVVVRETFPTEQDCNWRLQAYPHDLDIRHKTESDFVKFGSTNSYDVVEIAPNMTPPIGKSSYTYKCVPIDATNESNNDYFKWRAK